ncbi:MAG: indole-3-glycerol phosphate synthase TrpC [Planctomyces sp.]
MSTILDEIIQHKVTEIAAAKSRLPWDELRSRIPGSHPVRGFLKAIRQAQPPALIAEVKKASPSVGLIRPDFDPVSIARDYELSGATCLSILTDERFFQGHIDYLRQIRAAVSIPVMRKEFIIDRYQIAEARVAGADCVLLIAECLDDEQLQDLHDYAHELGMDTLIELYDAENLPRVLSTGAELIGINNRDLRTFHTTLDHTFRLQPEIPADVTLISESGIRNHEDVLRLRAAGIGGILVGESLMREPDIQNAVRKLMKGN